MSSIYLHATPVEVIASSNALFVQIKLNAFNILEYSFAAWIVFRLILK